MICYLIVKTHLFLCLVLYLADLLKKDMHHYFYATLKPIAFGLLISLSHLHDDSFLKSSKEFIK